MSMSSPNSLAINALSSIDIDTTEGAGRPLVYRLPPELLAYIFGFLSEFDDCPTTMARTALNLTHVSSWFRTVGIELQPCLWTCLPLHSIELSSLFYPRTGCSTIDLVWTDRLRWEDPGLELILAQLLNPAVIPRMRIFELVAPPDDDDMSVLWDSYRRVAGRIFRYLLPSSDAVQWSSLERIRVEGLDRDMSFTTADGIEEGLMLDDGWPSDYKAGMQYLDAYDLPLRSLPQLTDLTLRDLYPPTVRIVEALARQPSQIRTVTLTHLRRVPLHLLAEQFNLMPTLEHLELHDVSDKQPPSAWPVPPFGGICLHELRKLHITAVDPEVVKTVLQWVEMQEPAEIELAFPFVGEWTAGEPEREEYVRFYWTIGQRSRYFKVEPFEERMEGPVPDEEIADLKRIFFDLARELGAYMDTHENFIGLPLDVEMTDEEYAAGLDAEVPRHPAIKTMQVESHDDTYEYE